MATFDFITDDDLRTGLEADYAELQAAMEAKAYKAVHVLAGSIIEALLVDHLIGINYKHPKNVDLLTMDLGSLVQACKDKKVISDRVEDLSSVVRSYRNLIHPGRVMRLNEKVDVNTATVARALVEIIIGEIKEQRQRTYGYTAQQLMDKIERDPSVISILKHFLNQTNDIELRKLIRSIPDRFIEIVLEIQYLEAPYSYPTTLPQCYRIAFDFVPMRLKREAAQRYVDLIKHASEREIIIFGDYFFKPRHLGFLSDDDQNVAKTHILGRASQLMLRGKTELLRGIGTFLDKNEAGTLLADAILCVRNANDTRIVQAFLSTEISRMEAEVQEEIQADLQHWIDRSNPSSHQTISTDEELPF